MSMRFPLPAVRKALWSFEVPSDQKDFALGFEEYYEDESVGDLYVVYFTAE